MVEARKEGQTKRKEFVYYSSSLIIQSIVNRPTDPSPINSPTQNAVVCSAALDYYYVVNIDPSLTHSLACLVSQSVSQSVREAASRSTPFEPPSHARQPARPRKCLQHSNQWCWLYLARWLFS